MDPNGASTASAGAGDTGVPDTALDEIEQAIQDIGTQYLSHIRVLSQMLERYYRNQFHFQEDRVNDLTRQVSVRDDLIAELRSKLADAEQELSSLRKTCYLLEQKTIRYANSLRELGDELERDAKGSGVEQLAAVDKDGPE